MNLVKMISIVLVNLFCISVMAQTVNAEIEEKEPAPGISPYAVDVYIVEEDRGLFNFEEGIEKSYQVVVRLYLPELEFDAELVGAPEGMELLLTTDSKHPRTEKIYELVWKPSDDMIPDASIPSIVRFLTIRVNVGSDLQKLKEFRYTLYNGVL